MNWVIRIDTVPVASFEDTVNAAEPENESELTPEDKAQVARAKAAAIALVQNQDGMFLAQLEGTAVETTVQIKTAE